MDITKLPLSALYAMLHERKISSVEMTQVYLDKIKETDGKIGAYTSTCEEFALKSASKADEKIAAYIKDQTAEISKLCGIPMAVKDNICTKGIATTAASKMLLGGFVPPYDATVIERLKSAGAVMLGKVNMDEFAMGSTTENSAVKITRNPRALDRVPGGSSGGSAAAVAADESPYTLGSDTGGSIRLPASFCGAVGMKPTYGTVSRYGLIAFASSLDQIGPVTRAGDVRGNADVLDVISGHDRRDSTSHNRKYASFSDGIEGGVRGMKIGVAEEFFASFSSDSAKDSTAGISEDVRRAVESAIALYTKMGAEIVRVSLPSLRYALPAYYVISSAEASSNLSRFDGVRFGNRSKSADIGNITDMYLRTREEFGEEVKRRIMTGTFALSSGYYDAYYKKAVEVKARIRHEFAEVFTKCDILISPVSPDAAYKIGENSDPLKMYLGDIYTVPANIAGIPAIAIPFGETTKKLPIGVQLMGRHFSESTLYRAGYALENEVK